MTRVTTWSVRKITSHPFYEDVIGSMWDDDEFEDRNHCDKMAAGVDRAKERRDSPFQEACQ